MLGLVLPVAAPSLHDALPIYAVMVLVPASVFNVTLRLLVPPDRAVSPARAALASVEARWTVWVVVLTCVLLASTSLIVSANLVQAVAAEGVPVLPVALPGSADSPGANS